MHATLEQLTYPGETVKRLTELIVEGGVRGELARFKHYVRRLAGRGLLRIAVNTECGPLVTLMPTAPSFDPTDCYVPGGRYVLSRFAYVHRIQTAMIWESPLSASRLVVDDPRMAPVLLQMTAPVTAIELRTRAEFLSADAAEALLSLLATAELVSPVSDDGQIAEDVHKSLRMWEFHDLVFHARSRVGRHDTPSGGTFPWFGVIDPPAAVSDRDASAAMPLFRPNLEQLERQDPPFARVAEKRRSLRSYGREPVTVQQLGEFLYRVARIRERFNRDIELEDDTVTMGVTLRPYPSAGALYELELYLVVQRCDGLPPGIYHYDPLEHRLNRVSAEEQLLAELWNRAAVSAGIEAEDIQVLLVVAARFPRITWKYTSLAYSAILKHVGVLYESMYLTATAMKLAPCALGTGDSDVFAKAIGSDYYAETSVGEFLLGSYPDTLGDGPSASRDFE